mmetsp:Transcript_11419/g.33839  ORF Transcript_11419/g.33839 Transcript_11419/m.33839 type:complete len:226 (-) Transcript_11419:3512-4189(-)
MEVGEHLAEGRVGGHELCLVLVDVLLGNDARGGVHLHPLELGVEAVHGLDELRAAELDLGDARGLEDAAARRGVRVHLHDPRVDHGVDDHPGAAAHLGAGRDVDEDGLLVGGQVLHDVGAELEHLLEHVLATAREAAPVGQDDEGQALAVVEVVDGLGRLVGGVREPHLPGLRHFLLARFHVGGIREDCLHHEAVLRGDDAHWDAAEASSPDDHRARPVGEGLGE